MIESESSGPMMKPGWGVTPAGSVGGAAVRAAAPATAEVLWGSANATTADVLQAKQKAKIRAFSKIFRAPSKFAPAASETGTAGELCKYVARGRDRPRVTPNHSTTDT